MKIELLETTVATKNVKEIKNFYGRILGDEANIEDRDFFYTFKDSNNNDKVSFVPHNGQEKWDSPWLSMTSDDMEEALKHIKSLGVEEEKIDIMRNGDHITCFTFRDPDNRLVMIMKREEI